MEQRGTSVIVTSTEHAAICHDRTCNWFALGDKVLDEAANHYTGTGHHVTAQRKETTTWQWK